MFNPELEDFGSVLLSLTLSSFPELVYMHFLYGLRKQIDEDLMRSISVKRCAIDFNYGIPRHMQSSAGEDRDPCISIAANEVGYRST